MSKVAITRAIVSVYDKTGLDRLAEVLHKSGVEIVSTGSTAEVIAASGVPVTRVEDVTGFPECLAGRVKTLHPGVHAGLLADVRDPDHVAQLGQLGIAPFQLLVSNLYPFERTVAVGATDVESIEQIDIGGPAMVRAAAKNHANVAVVTSPSSYSELEAAVADGGFTLEQRRRLAAQAFAHTASYDAAVANWFAGAYAPDAIAIETGWPDVAAASWVRRDVLRYGENPHQRAALYIPSSASPSGPSSSGPSPSGPSPSGQGGSGAGRSDAGESAAGQSGASQPGPVVSGAGSSGALASRSAGSTEGVASAEQLHGKAMSYNNYVDADSAWRTARAFAEPCVAIMKHSNPCGIALGADIAEAHRRAHACDPVSAFGGVIAANRPVTAELAAQIAEIFTEVIIAPGYDKTALEILTKKKNQRLLRCALPPATAEDSGGSSPRISAAGTSEAPAVEWRQIGGGLLMQTTDLAAEPGDRASGWQLVAGSAVGPDTLADLEFAWRACRSVKSNAILLASGRASVGVGMGQVNRVDAARLAVARAGDRAEGSVAASDAFFPFADGLQVLTDAGVVAIAEPGGSVRDAEVIEAAEKAGVSLYFTGVRHFWH
ncbi:MAG TPA: bifunctional phosphoribosylaminoimidazolecarboxamide formyltransferase/inosine monophosphate cyclohydrolase [Streptosporangiaceae bacterium]|nr:bifunctional phosphoribosylaminoimidazolecarboxamide formyltransferase/inosine monophosphate cyclohydrolase [Streptosporangiaceae bacterium]